MTDCRDEKSTNSLKPDDLSDSNTYTSLYSNGHIEFSLELTTNFRCSLDLRVGAFFHSFLYRIEGRIHGKIQGWTWRGSTDRPREDPGGSRGRTNPGTVSGRFNGRPGGRPRDEPRKQIQRQIQCRSGGGSFGTLRCVIVPCWYFAGNLVRLAFDLVF